MFKLKLKHYKKKILVFADKGNEKTMTMTKKQQRTVRETKR